MQAYGAELARRRYESVDPENRLVAHTLETEWNQALLALEEARAAYEAQKPGEYELQSTLADMREVIGNLRGYWFAADIPVNEQKEILRCLIARVVLARTEKMIHTTIYWHGGTTSQLQVPKYLFSSPYIYWRISELAKTHTDREIGDVLNEEGIQTVKGKPWTDRRVMDFRHSNGIASGFTVRSDLRISDSGYVTTSEAAAALGISVSTVENWFKQGILDGKRDKAGATIWIAWSEEVAYRLSGGATPDPRMVTIRSLCKARDQTPAEILQWAKREGYQIHRLRRGKAFKFYVSPAGSSARP